MTAAVADAGPLIHLAEIGLLRTLQIVQTLYVPDEVWLETVGMGRVEQEALEALAVIQRETVTATEVEQLIRAHGLERLHQGEKESFALCRARGVSLLFTDDLAAREAARDLGLTPVGSLGIIVRACRQGLVSDAEAEEGLRDLYDVSTLFVTAAIVDMALDQLRQLGES